MSYQELKKVKSERDELKRSLHSSHQVLRKIILDYQVIFITQQEVYILSILDVVRKQF
jgi:hypothetical protein